MNHRWYDKNPTLSMAVSLLQNASHTHQEMTARYLFSLMESQGLMDSGALKTQSAGVRFIFPTFRRSGFEIHARHLVEVMKHLPEKHQQELAVTLINYIYILDSGMTDLPFSDDSEIALLPQSELG